MQNRIVLADKHHAQAFAQWLVSAYAQFNYRLVDASEDDVGFQFELGQFDFDSGKTYCEMMKFRVVASL